MKKTYIFIATVIVCCLFLWIGFYAGWTSKTVTTPTEEKKSDSLFEKQNKCASYYETYKDKLSYVFNEPKNLKTFKRAYSGRACKNFKYVGFFNRNVWTR